MTATVSVIVPSYHRPDSLVRCLNALASGSMLPDRVLIVVRGDDTDTCEALARWIETPPERLNACRVDVLEPGQIAAMNAGLQAATEDIVCFIDDDTAPHPDWLANLLRHYADPAVGGVGGRDIVHQDGTVLDGRVREVGKLRWYGRMIGNHHLQLDGGPVPVDHLKGANMSFRRRLLPPFDERLATGSCCLNDTDVSLSVTAQGYRLIYDPQAAVDHITAPRHCWVSRDTADAELVYSDSHNWVYCLLKHLGPARRAVFLAYALLVGEGTRYGLLKALASLPGHGLPALSQFRASTRGKLSALRTYAAWRGSEKTG